MPLVKKPARPVPRSYFAPNTFPYKVKDGEDWVKIAKRHHVEPWEIIDVNFKTDDPREVNWYLRNYVGCTRTSPDGKNYKFSSVDKPGTIRVPVPVRVHIKHAIPRVPPPPPDPTKGKKQVLVGLIERVREYNVDTFGKPGSVRWTGHKRIIREKYAWVPKNYARLGTAKGRQLHYSATAFSRTTIRRYVVLWGPKGSSAMKVLKGAGKVGFTLIKILTGTLEGAVGTTVYKSWNDYPRDSSDPMNKFRP